MWIDESNDEMSVLYFIFLNVYFFLNFCPWYVHYNLVKLHISRQQSLISLSVDFLAELVHCMLNVCIWSCLSQVQ